MTFLNKLLLILLAITIIGAVGFIIYQQHEMSAIQTQIGSSMVAQKTLLDNITRSQATYATKQDLDTFAAQNNVNLATIQKDVETLNATVSGMNQVIVNSGGDNQNHLPSTSTTPNPTPTTSTTSDPYKYQENQQNLTLTEPFGQTQVPIGTVGFSAWQQSPWNVNTYPRSYDITNVLATDQNGRNYVYNQFSITANGKTYTLPIATAKFVQQYPTPSFSWLNPRIFLTAGGSAGFDNPVKGSANVGATVGIMSYGQSKVTPAISILQVGAVFETGTQKAAAIINPVNFNLSGILPKGLIDSTYIGPSLQIDAAANVLVGANLSIGF